MRLPRRVQFPEPLGHISRCERATLAVSTWSSRNEAVDDHLADMDAAWRKGMREDAGSLVLSGHADGERSIAGGEGIDPRIVQRHDAAGGQHTSPVRLQIGKTRLHGSDVTGHANLEAPAQISERHRKQITLDVEKPIPVQDADWSRPGTRVRNDTPHGFHIAQVGWKSPCLNAFTGQLRDRSGQALHIPRNRCNRMTRLAEPTGDCLGDTRAVSANEDGVLHLQTPILSNYNVGVDISMIFAISTTGKGTPTMAWDTEGTKRRILEAATTEFARLGPDGTTIEQIAKTAGVNKERVYNYFGDKRALFSAVLRSELAKVAQAMPVTSFAVEDIGEYAGRVYDYHREHPELSRLMRWEGLTFDGQVPDEEQRREYYGYKVQAVAEGQRRGVVTDALEADHLAFLVLSLAGWWSAVPQVARMVTGPESKREHARRRASVIEAARRLASAR